ncbi:TPA: recombinase family protein [Bacillus nitratireducens]
MKKAVCYYRKSIELEADKSIARQREVVHQYAKENNIEIIREFEEVGSSAALDREELQNMLQYLGKERNIDYILLHSFDRASREVEDLGWIFSQLKKIMKVKARLHSATEENDYEDDHIKMFFIMMKTFGSTQERVNIVKRLQEARQLKAKKGGYIGGSTPLGYQALKGTAVLHIKESEVPTVKRIFELREEKMTMQEICDVLNKEGFRTRRNKEFQPMTVQRVLKNSKVYQGETEAPGIL